MQEFTVRFQSVRDVQDFVALATEYTFPIVVGTESYHVNGTSFMGMFSLDHSRPMKVKLTCTPEEFDTFRQRASRFLAE